MIILCLGLPSSASTWAYNVTRGLLVETRPEAVGVFAQSAADLQAAVPAGTKDLILKAHTLDEPLLRLVETSDTALVLTWRDPRDAAVSMAQRTGLELGACVGDIQRSASVILSLLELKKPETIVLNYGDDYMNREETIHGIARVLGVRPSMRLVRQLFQSLKTSTLKKSIDAWSSSLGPDATFSSHVDMATHWHKNHLGDGRNGKWREAEGDWGGYLDAALAGYQEALEGRIKIGVTPPWDRICRSARIARTRVGAQPIWSNAATAEIHLPRGWWNLSFEFAPRADQDHLLELAVECRGQVIAQRVIATTTEPTTYTTLFEHNTPGSPIQVRLGGLQPDGESSFSLSNLNFNRISSLDATTRSSAAARRVSERVLPSR